MIQRDMNTQEIEQSILDNQKLVYFAIHKYFPNLRSDEDIVQVGLIGLWQACVHYDSSKGKFSTFAVRCIINEMRRELHSREKSQKLGYIVSLDEPVCSEWDSDEEITLAHLIADPRDNYCAIDYDISFLKDKLSKRDLDVLMLNVCGFEQAEIGRIFGFTQVWACRRIKKRNLWPERNLIITVHHKIAFLERSDIQPCLAKPHSTK